MSNPLKRALDPVEEADDVTFNVPGMQAADSPPDLFSDILLHPSVSNQMLLGIEETDYNLASALTEWGNYMAVPDFYLSQSTLISSQATSHSPSIAPDSIQLTAESVTSTDDEETICFGMVSDHHVSLSDLSDLGRASSALAAQRRRQAHGRDANDRCQSRRSSGRLQALRAQ